MKVLVEIDLPGIEPNDIYKPNSGWFIEPGFIDIPENYIDSGWKFRTRFKYM